uniref:Chromosome 11 open reading frame 86 n=1 Tax=Spermophilus dauricus TaxID=99837 RepID=A0A8C9UK51_SPEDA
MGTGLRSQSLRGPRRHSYGKLQEPWGRPLKGQLHRAVSLRQGHEQSRSQGLDGGTDVQKVPAQKSQPALGRGEDTEQLIQTPPRGWRWWLRRCQQQVRRKWDSFVTSIPNVTVSRPASQKLPLDSS